MTPTDLRQNFVPVKSVGLHYTHFRNHLPLFMRLPGPKNPKNCQILRRVAKVGLVRICRVNIVVDISRENFQRAWIPTEVELTLVDSEYEQIFVVVQRPFNYSV